MELGWLLGQADRVGLLGLGEATERAGLAEWVVGLLASALRGWGVHG